MKPLPGIRSSGLYISLLAAFVVFVPGSRAITQEATVTESLQTFRTHPFSDPDPVARMGNIYPYFRYQGYSISPADLREVLRGLVSIQGSHSGIASDAGWRT